MTGIPEISIMNLLPVTKGASYGISMTCFQIPFDLQKIVVGGGIYIVNEQENL